MVQQLSTNTFGTAKWIVSSDATQGTHTTIAGALTSASSGDTIFIRTGTYTENLTLKAGVNLTAYDADALTPNVIILGNTTATFTGVVTISGIQLQTNGAACLTSSGSNVGTLYLVNCNMSASNATGMAINNANFTIQCRYSNFSTAANNLLFAVTTAAGISFFGCVLAAGTAANTIAAGSIDIVNCRHGSYSITTSSTATFAARNSTFDNGSLNQTVFTLAGTGSGDVANCFFNSGSASTFSVGTGTTFSINNSEVSSTNTNAITGAGTLNIGDVVFGLSSSTINTTTIAGFTEQHGPIQMTGATAYTVLCGGTALNKPLQSIASVGTSGQVLTSNGAGALPTFQSAPADVFSSITVQTFTSSGTYTPTSGMLFCTIECVGGGGGSGGITNSSTASSVQGTAGGGGGGYARKTVTAATIGVSQIVTIGAAGTAGANTGTNGGTGGTTSVGAIVSATGGGGSGGGTGTGTIGMTIVGGGGGGGGASGDLNATGGVGGAAIGVGGATFGQILGGYGGNSIYGGGGAPTAANSGGGSAGNAGSIYGGGASGATSANNTGAKAGAAGAAGIVIITEYV